MRAAEKRIVDRFDERIFALLTRAAERFDYRTADKALYRVERSAIAREIRAVKAARRAITLRPFFVTPARLLRRTRAA